MPSACPSLEELAAFLEHSLTPEEQQSMVLHLIECRTCREILKEAVSGIDLPSPKGA